MHIININTRAFILLLIILISITGCAGCSTSRNVSANKEWWGGYNNNQEYVLQKSVFLLMNDTKNYFIVPDKSVPRSAGIMSAPDSIAEYLKNSDEVTRKFEAEWRGYSDTKVVGVIYEGTRIKTHRLEKMYGLSFWWGFESGLDIYGKILDGKFAGHEVNMQDVSTFLCCGSGCDDDPILYKPDQRLLK